LVKDLDAGIGSLRRAGHNIIFANVCLKALREVPEAATPARIAGLREMVKSFGSGGGGQAALAAAPGLVDLSDETKFVHFVLEEYLKALELYRSGLGHHGFAGHVLTIGHALLELRRAGYKDTADQGVRAYWQFVRQARAGADLGGQKIADAPPQPTTPRDRDYWVGQRRRNAGHRERSRPQIPVQPLRVGEGSAGRGADATSNREALLPHRGFVKHARLPP
jgi:hypothetical protein